MALEQWTMAAEMLSSVAVVASLIYLAIQVRQSNALARAQTRQVMMQMGQQEINKFVDDPSIWNLWTKEELSRDERIRLHSWLVAHLRQREYEWLEKQEGIIDPKMFEAYAAVISLVLGTERTRRWWSVHSHSPAFDAGFVTFVDELLAKSPLTDYFESMDKW